MVTVNARVKAGRMRDGQMKLWLDRLMGCWIWDRAMGMIVVLLLLPSVSIAFITHHGVLWHAIAFVYGKKKTHYA